MALQGFFGKIFKKVVTAIGTAIGGPVGGYVANTLFSIGESLINGNPIEGNTFNPFVNEGNIFGQRTAQKGTFTIKPEILNPDQTQEAESIKQENLKNWFETKITESWINWFFKEISLNGKSDNAVIQDWYRKNINTILLRIETLRLYYKGLENKTAQKGVIQSVDELIKNEEVKSKAQFFKLLGLTVRNSYEKAVKEDFNKSLYTKTLVNFKANNFPLKNKQPEAVNFDFQASSSIDLYVFNQNENVTITYKDGTKATTQGSGITPDTPVPTTIETEGEDNSSTTEEFSTTNLSNQTKNAGLWIGGLLVGGWVAKKLGIFKSK